MFHNKQKKPSLHQAANITRIATLNVFSMRNKLAAIKQCINDYGISIMVITETNIQEGDSKKYMIDGMTEVSSSKREKGNSKGGVAIYVSQKIPCYAEYKRITNKPNELEHCAAVVFPNHNPNDKLAIVGIYRPPEKQHPPYQEAFERMLKINREHRITTMIMGDLNTPLPFLLMM